MNILKWLKTLPTDILLAFVFIGCIVFFSALTVAFGPALPVMLCALLSLLPLAGTALFITVLITIGPHRRKRILPLFLTSGCVITGLVTPDLAVDLHLVTRIYLAGGPNAINNWGQKLIQDQRGATRSRYIERDELPEGIRDHLPGAVIVRGMVRIELGGGFYHYGLMVLPTGTVPQRSWWQKVLRWPADVIIYHEE